MRTLGNKELDAVAGGRLPRGDGLADWIDGLIASLTVSVHGSLDRTDGGGGSSVCQRRFKSDPSFGPIAGVSLTHSPVGQVV